MRSKANSQTDSQDDAGHAHTEVDPVVVREELRRIQASRVFAGSKKLSDFLAYVVTAKLAGRGPDLKETSIAVGLHERSPSYDPKADSIVRTQAKRVRERLEDYYASEGVADPVRILLPKGGYVPVFETRVPAAEPVPGETATPLETPAPPVRNPARPEDRSADHGARREVVPRWIPWLALLLVVSIGLSTYLWERRFAGQRGDQPAASKSPRVVVLRFKGQTGHAEDELYGRAMADAVVSWLVRIKDVSVLTQSESVPPPAAGASDVEIARTLKADYIVSGDFKRDAHDAGIRVLLTQTANAAVLLSRSYTFAWPNLVHVEDELGEAVSQALATRLGQQQPRGLSAVPPATAIAYRAFLDGHSAAVLLRQTLQAEAALTAERNLKRALEADPNYADALAELGGLRLFYAQYRIDESPALIAEAEGYARKALTAAPRHVPSQAVLAAAAVLRSRPMEGLELARRAVDEDPNDAQALDSLAEAYEALGLYESALAIYDRVTRMDSTEVDPFVFGGLLLAQLGRFDEAGGRARAFAAINSASPHIPFIEVEILMAEGNDAAAEAMLKQLQESFNLRLADRSRQPYLFGFVDEALALAQVRQGRPDFARKTLAQHGALFPQHFAAPILLDSALGLPKEAIRDIEISPFFQNYRYLISQPGLKPLYGEQKFQELLDRAYTDWVRALEELRDSLPAQPPKLLPPGEFLAANGIRISR